MHVGLFATSLPQSSRIMQEFNLEQPGHVWGSFLAAFGVCWQLLGSKLVVLGAKLAVFGRFGRRSTQAGRQACTQASSRWVQMF